MTAQIMSCNKSSEGFFSGGFFPHLHRNAGTTTDTDTDTCRTLESTSITELLSKCTFISAPYWFAPCRQEGLNFVPKREFFFFWVRYSPLAPLRARISLWKCPHRCPPSSQWSATEEPRRRANRCGRRACSHGGDFPLMSSSPPPFSSPALPLPSRRLCNRPGV